MSHRIVLAALQACCDPRAGTLHRLDELALSYPHVSEGHGSGDCGLWWVGDEHC